MSVVFDHRDPGTDPDDWAAFLRAESTGTIDPTAWASIVVVAPHPDDETLGAGGLIATASDLGVPVHVLLVTDGAGSHPDSPTVSPDRLAGVRETEFVAALHTLHGHTASTVLGLRDGTTREHRGQVESAVAAALADAPRPTLLVGPWQGDGHRDHRIVGEVVAAAVADDVDVLAYPIWAWHWDTPAASVMPWADARVLPLSTEVVDRKRDALAAHVSQTVPLSDAPGDEAVVDDRHAAHHLRQHEWYFAVGAAASGSASSQSQSQTQPQASSQAQASSRSRSSFEEHYARKPEGWDFAGWYEQRKRAVTMSALPSPRYRSALEIGCATGVLTAAIAERADAVLGIDITEAPLVAARDRVPAARFARMSVPAEWPEGRFDLVVLSEIGYYLSAADLDATIDRIARSLDDDGVLVACHWRHPDTEATSDGDTVDRQLAERWPRAALVRHVEEDFVLSVLPGPGRSSVARAEGIVR